MHFHAPADTEMWSAFFFSGSRLRQNIPVGEYIITDTDVTAGSSS